MYIVHIRFMYNIVAVSFINHCSVDNITLDHKYLLYLGGKTRESF